MASETIQVQQPAEPASASLLWTRFANATTSAEFYHAWLALLCGVVPGARLGVLVLVEEGQFVPAAQWPPERRDGALLVDILDRVVRQNTGLISELDENASEPHTYAIAYPVHLDSVLTAAVALEVEAATTDGLRKAMQQLQWGVGWVELRMRREGGAESIRVVDRLKATVDLLACVLAEEQFGSACMAFVTELAGQMGCERASIGFVEDRRVRVRAVSYTTDFGEKMNLNRALAVAMDEAVLQRQPIRFPAAGEDALVVRDHEQLAKQHGVESILTVPLYYNERYYAVITLERSGERPFTEEDEAFCTSAAGLAGPSLESRRLEDRPMPLKLKDSLIGQVQRMTGTGYVGRKLLVGVAAALLIFFAFAQGDYRVSSDSTLEGAVRRAVVAPFDGFIFEAPARAGDVVEEGDLICRLDDRDLRLERVRWLGEVARLRRQLQEATADYDRSQVSILSAQLDQTQAQLELAEARLERTQLRAAFNGLVVSGDLSQRLGGAVQHGEVLFEVTPLDAYRVLLEVDEGRIADVHVGQTGSLVLSALPEETFGFSVEKVTPIATPEEGRNTFRVEAALDRIDPVLRPGMEGVGKIDVDRRLLIGVWTRDLRDWIRFKWWEYVP